MFEFLDSNLQIFKSETVVVANLRLNLASGVKNIRCLSPFRECLQLSRKTLRAFRTTAMPCCQPPDGGFYLENPSCLGRRLPHAFFIVANVLRKYAVNTVDI